LIAETFSPAPLSYEVCEKCVIQYVHPGFLPQDAIIDSHFEVFRGKMQVELQGPNMQCTINTKTKVDENTGNMFPHVYDPEICPDPSYRPESNIAFSKDLLSVYDACAMQDSIEKCDEISNLPPPYAPLQRCISLCPLPSVLNSEATFDGSKLKKKIEGIQEVQKTIGCKQFRKILDQQDLMVTFVIAGVTSCFDLQTKMKILGCCTPSSLPPLNREVVSFLKDTPGVRSVNAEIASSFTQTIFFNYINFTIILTFLTFCFLCYNVKKGSIKESEPLLTFEI